MTDAELERLLVLDDGPGPALPIDAMYADALIEAALDGAGFVGGPGGGGSGGGAGGSSGAAGSAAGMKIALGVAALVAAVAIVLVLARRGRGGEQEAVAALPDAALPDAAIEGGSGVAVAIEPAVDPAIEPQIEPEIEIAPEPARPDRPAKLAPSAADLLGEANAKRAAKQWREADVLYAKVVERAKKGLAAQSALISSATIRLEHLGDPKGAAQRFRRALAMAPGGALAEDARWGLVEAARALKDREAEAAALDDFLAHHAGSPLAGPAKARREAIR